MAWFGLRGLKCVNQSPSRMCPFYLSADLSVCCGLRWVPESVRWLLVSGRKEEARAILEHAARVNKKEMPKDDLLVPVVPESSKGCLDLLSTKAMTVSTLFQCFAW